MYWPAGLHATGTVGLPLLAGGGQPEETPAQHRHPAEGDRPGGTAGLHTSLHLPQQSRVSVWDPQHGEVQAEIHLPVAMETLDSMPDVTPWVEQYNDVMNSLPDEDTVQYFYDNVS